MCYTAIVRFLSLSATEKSEFSLRRQKCFMGTQSYCLFQYENLIQLRSPCYIQSQTVGSPQRLHKNRTHGLWFKAYEREMKKMEKSVTPTSQEVFKSIDVSLSDLAVRILTFQAHNAGGMSSSTGLRMPCPCHRAGCVVGNAPAPRAKSQPPALCVCVWSSKVN